MLQSQGPVNWEIAQQIARSRRQRRPRDGRTGPEPAIDPAATQRVRRRRPRRADSRSPRRPTISAALVGAVALRRPPVVGRTSTAASGARARSWASLAQALATRATGSTAGDRGRPTPARDRSRPTPFFGDVDAELVPLLLGVWSGSMIGYLAQHALGQYDLPLPLDGRQPELLFVVRNVDAFARGVVAAGRRAALRARAARGRARRAAVGAVGARAARAARHDVRRRVRGAARRAARTSSAQFDPSDPSSMASARASSRPRALLGAMRSERQGPMLEELQRFVVGARGLRRRRRRDARRAAWSRRTPGSTRRCSGTALERGEAGAFVDRLLGLELDRDHYEPGVAFCRGVDRARRRLDRPAQPAVDEPSDGPDATGARGPRPLARPDRPPPSRLRTQLSSRRGGGGERTSRRPVRARSGLRASIAARGGELAPAVAAERARAERRASCTRGRARSDVACTPRRPGRRRARPSRGAVGRTTSITSRPVDRVRAAPRAAAPDRAARPRGRRSRVDAHAARVGDARTAADRRSAGSSRRPPDEVDAEDELPQRERAPRGRRACRSQIEQPAVCAARRSIRR